MPYTKYLGIGYYQGITIEFSKISPSLFTGFIYHKAFDSVLKSFTVNQERKIIQHPYPICYFNNNWWISTPYFPD